ncbi:DHA2 family multidrug resistance protein-like MFS transporter [Kitasatospora sp. MAA4]|uniref:MFS transporter n=1 Tax=Kitasatospora sp. MAA4 TaxID=3035093 RepID=UPI002474873E|nr:MFS transporter [Kitasatospora sp. MAA4]MDH6132243.1 DHA2 family multidrug resistance protein-like MFS transporter [Kitasatospora sp. MAA4]
MGEQPVAAVRRWATLGISCLAALLLAVDATVLTLAVPALTRSLRPSANQILWIADVYGFVLGGLLITMGNLGDRIGRKRLLLLGTTVFAIASASAAFAPSPELLIAARAVLGVAGATIMPSTLSILRSVFTDPAERTAAIGIWSSSSVAGFALGPIVGGLLLAHFWWGSVFLINVPVCALVLVAGLLVLPESRDPRPGRLDVASVALSVVGMVAAIYAVKEAVRSGLPHTRVVVAAVLGIGGLGLFARRQTRLAEPLIDLRLFRRREYAVSLSAALVAMFVTAALSLLFAQYFQLVLGWSQLRSGLAGLPGAVAAVLGGATAAPALARWGHGRVVPVALGSTGLGCVLYLPVGTTANYPVVLLAMVVLGTGVGMSVAVTNHTVVGAITAGRAGAAAAVSETAFEVGGALGIALVGSVLNAVYRARLVLPPDLTGEQAGRLRESIGAALADAPSLPTKSAAQAVAAARHAFVDGIHVATLTCAAVAVLPAVVTFFAMRARTVAEQARRS